jgi:hypothetical protein
VTEPTPRDWLIEPYLPDRELTLVTGARRSGKGLFCALVAALASRGRRPEWDLAYGEPTLVRRVFWFTGSTGEDTPQEIRDRFLTADGDPAMFTLVALGQNPFETMKQTLDLAPPGPKLVVLDPLQGVLRDLARSDARTQMENLVGLARTTESAVLAIRHLRDDGRARGRGEIADVVRSEIVVGHHPDVLDLVVVAQAPSSYGEGPPVAFRIAPVASTVALVHVTEEWDDTVEPIDLVPAAPRRRRTARRLRLEREIRFLLVYLGPAPRLRSEVMRDGRRRRLSPRSIARAAVILGVISDAERDEGRFGEALWTLPSVLPDWHTVSPAEVAAAANPPATPPSANRQDRQVASFAEPDGSDDEREEAPTPAAAPRPAGPRRDENGFVALWPAPAAPRRTKKPKPPKSEPDPLSKDFDIAHIVERFKRLDLD